jgi:hypothetical protein
MAMDPVSICNIALGWIGQDKIRTIDPDEADGAAEELCSTFFEPDVRSTLEETAWLFATGSKPLDLGAPQETGDPNFPVFFAVGSEVVAIRYVFDASGDPLEWEKREGGVVTQDTNQAFAIATTFKADPGLWPPAFCRAVAARIAADIAGPLTESPNLELKMEQRYEKELSKAMIFDGKQGTAVTINKHTPLSSMR